MTTPPPGTYSFPTSGRLTVFEPVSAANPPAGSDVWPVAEVSETFRLTVLAAVSGSERAEIVALSRRLAERLAAVPADRRAELLAAVNAEIARAAG